MKILTIGDVVGAKSVEYLSEKLWKKRSELGADLCVVNGENATDIYGCSPTHAQEILSAGADLITLGNHAFGRRDLCEMLGSSEVIIRPANYPPLAPGGGYTYLHVGGWRILCINVMGTALMESLACPFATVERILDREEGRYDFALLDIHAEATSEKIALARYFDGRIHVMFGTHTHVPTADEQILPHGSGYITDLGMVGARDSIVGADILAVTERCRTKMGGRLKVATGEIRAEGALFTLDATTKRVTSVERVRF